jgi:hypothetical protein
MAQLSSNTYIQQIVASIDQCAAENWKINIDNNKKQQHT